MKISCSTKLSDVGIAGRFIVLFLIPFIFTWIMFDPYKTYSINTNISEPQIINRSDISENLTKTALAEFFQTSLSLGWYEICLNNNTALQLDNSVIKVTDPDERGIVSVGVKTNLLDKNYLILKSLPFNKPSCLRINSNVNSIEVGTTTIFTGAIMDISKINFKKYNTLAQSVNVSLYIKEDVIAFIIKYFIVLILWIHLVFLIPEIENFLFRNKTTC